MRIKSSIFNNLYSFGVGIQCAFCYSGDTVRTLIVGQNNDEPGADSNGAGKSNILNSIVWIIFGFVFQDENADDIIRKGQTWCSGESEFIKDNGDILKIARGRGNGAKKFLHVFYNGENKTQNTDTETQKVLLKYLNIPESTKESEYISDFINTVYFSSDVVKSFMGKKTTSKDRFAIVERYLGLKRYALASESSKSKKKERLEIVDKHYSKITEFDTFINNNPIDVLNNSILETTQKKESLLKQIADYESAIKDQQDFVSLQSEIERLKDAIAKTRSSYLTALTSLEQEHKSNVQAIETNTKAVDNYLSKKAEVDRLKPEADQATAKKQEIEQKIYSHRQAITTYHTDIGSDSITAKSLKEQIAHLYKCPGCGIDIMVSNSKVEKADLKALSQTLVEVEGIKTANLQKVVIEQQAIDKEVLEGKKLDSVIEDFAVAQKTLLQMPKPEDLQPDIDSKTNRNMTVLAEYARLDAEAEQKIGGMQKTLLELETRLGAIAKPEQTVEDLMRCMDQAKNSVSDYDKLLGNIDATLKQIKVAEGGRTREGVSATAAKHQVDIYGFWETSFNEIKMDIIDEFLPDFEDKVNEYLSRLKVNLRVRFGTQKEKSGASKKDKELGRAFKEEFNVEVFKEDNIPLPYGLLSKGQRSRCGNCVGMALRELTKERGNNVFDFFFLDEVSDSLDESGLRELVNLLDETPGQKLVISHNNFLKDYFNDRIVVEMTNEISTIRQEAA